MLTAFVQSDRAVMRKVLGGNAGAFRVLVDRYGGVVHGVAYAWLRNTADAEDIAQETFIRLWRQLDQMAHRKRIGPWLVKVARNVSVDLVRRRGRDAALAEQQPGERVETPDPSREDLHRILYEQLDKLDGDSREVLILYYFMKKRAREIAALLEITPEAAAKRIQRARDELGRRLTDLLGDELDEAKADAHRGERILLAVLAVPVGWKASVGSAAAAATAAGVATGAGAAKLAMAVAVIAAAAVVGYVEYERRQQPDPPPDVTAQSIVSVEDTPPAEVTAEVLVEPAVAEKPQPAVPESAGYEGEYAPVYGKMSGVVTMEDGTPAADAEVWLDNEGEVERGNFYARKDNKPLTKALRFAARTDSSGRYEISGFPLMNMYGGSPIFMLRAEKSGQFAEVEPLTTLLEREMVRDLALHPSVRIGGVLKGSDGQPVAGTFVGISEEKSSQTRERLRLNGVEVLSGADGAFLFEHVRQGLYRFTVNAEGHLHFESDWLQAGRTDYELQLDLGSLISGRVVDVETGDGVAHVRISGHSESEKRGAAYASLSGKTDEKGFFEIGGCVPGAYTLSIYPRFDEVLPLLLAEPLVLTLGAEPMTGLEIKMARGAVLRGTVIDDETGLPVSAGCFVGATVNGHARSCRTGDGGAYEIVGLQQGEGNVLVSCDADYKRVRRYAGSVTIAPGEMEKTHDIHLPVRALLSGTAVNEAGKPVPWASICAFGEDRERLRLPMAPTLGDEFGRWSVDIYNEIHGGIRPLNVYLQAIADDGCSGRVGPFDPGKRNGEIVLAVVRSGRLEGEVVTREGRAVEQALIAVPDSADAILPSSMELFRYPQAQRLLADGKMIRQIKAGGRFEYTQLRPGQYTLEIYPSSGEHDEPAATARVSVQAGRTTKARLVVDYGTKMGGVEGLVLMNGKPAGGVRVQAGPGNSRTGADGRYTLHDLSPGYCMVTALPPDDTFTERRQGCDIVAGQMSRVDFELSGGGTIEGHVRNNGQADSRAQLHIFNSEDPEGESFTATTSADGYFRVDHVPDGAYRVIVTVSNLSDGLDVVTATGQTTRAEFDFRSGAITGTVSGLREGEKAHVAVLPADAYLGEWTIEALDALGERIVMDAEVGGDGSYAFDPIREGEYVVVAAAITGDVAFDAAAVLNGRVAISPGFVLAAGGTVEMPLEVK